MLGIAGAICLPGQADARSTSGQRTVAVFQDFDGAPCRIVFRPGVDNFVQCYTRGVWRDKETSSKKVAPSAARPNADSKPVVRTKVPTVLVDDLDVWQTAAEAAMVAQRARSAVFDFEFAEYM